MKYLWSYLYSIARALLPRFSKKKKTPHDLQKKKEKRMHVRAKARENLTHIHLSYGTSRIGKIEVCKLKVIKEVTMK